MEREIDYYSLGNQRPGIELDLTQAKARIKELENEIQKLKDRIDYYEQIQNWTYGGDIHVNDSK